MQLTLTLSNLLSNAGEPIVLCGDCSLLGSVTNTYTKTDGERVAGVEDSNSHALYIVNYL